MTLEEKFITDPDAQFENRWLDYSLNDGFKFIIGGALTIVTGLIIGTSIISHPYLLPLALVPGRARDYILNKHKKSKREDLLKPVEYPIFKI